MMGVEQMRLALQAVAINTKKHAEALRSENATLLQHIGLKQEVQNFLAEFSFDSVLEIGAFRYDQANCFKKNYDWEEDFQLALRADLLLVGSGISGDIVALDLADYQVGILFHDYFWGEEEENPRKFLIKMNCSLGQFFLNSAIVKEYPIDAYEAAAYMGSDFTGYWSPDTE